MDTTIIKSRIGTVNGLRGYAILAVIFHHLFWQFTQPGWQALHLGNITILPFTFLSNGWLGVNLFFILSGFVLYLPFIQQKRHLNSLSDFLSFYLHRAKRLLPLYYFSSLTLILFFTSQIDNTHLNNIIRMLTLTFPFFNEDFLPPYNGVLWSLGIEMLFSLLFPFLVLFLTKNNVKKSLIIILLISLTARFIGVILPIFDIGQTYLNPFKDSLLGRMDDFFVGMIACHLYFNKFFIQKYQKYIYHLLLLGISLMLISFISWDYIVLKIFPPLVSIFINNLVQLGFFLILFSLLLMPKNFISFFFTNPFIQLAGMMSYSLYIWCHIAITRFIISYTFTNILLFILFYSLFAFLSYRFIEFGHVNRLKDILPQGSSK